MSLLERKFRSSQIIVITNSVVLSNVKRIGCIWHIARCSVSFMFCRLDHQTKIKVFFCLFVVGVVVLFCLFFS